MRLGPGLLYEGRTLQGARPKLADFCSATMAEFYSAVDSRAADVISTVTASTGPIIQGHWLKPGSHLDLIGAFKGDMRESDDQAITQAELFVDLRAGASLAGDLAQPLDAGQITPGHIRADLAELCQRAHPGRRDDTARTVFKSAGMALQDLAAANLARDHAISG